MEPFSSLGDAYKLIPRYLAPIGVVSALLLFLPEKALNGIGLANLAKDHRPVIGLCLLFCCAVGLIAMGRAVYGRVRKWNIVRRRKQRCCDRLLQLTEEEKQILRFYIAEQTRTNVLRMSDGVVQGLVASGVIYRSSNLGSLAEGFAFNISDTAWEVLNEHYSLLVGDTDFSRTDRRKELRY